MTGFVLDVSVKVAWCFADEVNAASDELLDRLRSHGAVVPALWPIETANVRLQSERRRRVTRYDADRFVELLQNLPIVVDTVAPERVLGSTRDLARMTALTEYDAAYLDLVLRLDLPLATRDRELAEAAKAAGAKLLPA